MQQTWTALFSRLLIRLLVVSDPLIDVVHGLYVVHGLVHHQIQPMGRPTPPRRIVSVLLARAAAVIRGQRLCNGLLTSY